MLTGNETDQMLENKINPSLILGKFERAKILQVYFARLDGREPEEIPGDYYELYEVELTEIKKFLLGQHPQDLILQNIFKIMN